MYVANDGSRPLQRTHNILLLGMDQPDLDYVGRTDTVMLLALDAENDRAALISIPRDIYLPIPGVGYSRINTAYSYGETRQKGGGIPLVVSTFEKNFGVPIHNYVRIDFAGFEDVVDALGGVDVSVDCAITDKAIRLDFEVPYLEPGEYHMTGKQALTYARSRKTTTDFDRARRQQRVLLALRDRVLDAGLIPRIPALWMALGDTVETDLDAAAIVELARFGANMDNKQLLGMVIRSPLVTDWITPQGGQVQLPDLPAIAGALDDIWNRKPLSETNGEERSCP
jgi:LCP family protein required for cell wall assembly